MYLLYNRTISNFSLAQANTHTQIVFFSATGLSPRAQTGCSQGWGRMLTQDCVRVCWTALNMMVLILIGIRWSDRLKERPEKSLAQAGARVLAVCMMHGRKWEEWEDVQRWNARMTRLKMWFACACVSHRIVRLTLDSHTNAVVMRRIWLLLVEGSLSSS